MNRLKNQIEAQIQEVVFFSSLVLAFTFFISGVFYLAMGGTGLEFVLGSFGEMIERGFFSAFGYGYFYLAFAALHMGFITNLHIFNFNDFKREYPVLAYSALAHIILLVLFSNTLSVIQFSLGLTSSELLPYGSGGFVGAFIAKGLYAVAGLYGSLLVLTLFKITTGLVAEFYELKDLHSAIKTSVLLTKKSLVQFFKMTHQFLTQSAQFFLKDSDFSDMALQSSLATKSWISNSVSRANNLFTEHFHIYTAAKEEAVKAPPVVAKKEEKEKPIRNKTARSAAEKLLGRASTSSPDKEVRKEYKKSSSQAVVSRKKNSTHTKKHKNSSIKKAKSRTTPL
jgi:hypothetical protein